MLAAEFKNSEALHVLPGFSELAELRVARIDGTEGLGMDGEMLMTKVFVGRFGVRDTAQNSDARVFQGAPLRAAGLPRLKGLYGSTVRYSRQLGC